MILKNNRNIPHTFTLLFLDIKPHPLDPVRLQGFYVSLLDGGKTFENGTFVSQAGPYRPEEQCLPTTRGRGPLKRLLQRRCRKGEQKGRSGVAMPEATKHKA
jgi:hypothetical protein